MRILEGQGVTKRFGGLAAVSNVDFHVDQGEIVGLIGPNGAGKTTLFNLISAALPLSSGEIRFEGQRLNGLKPHQICKMGIARTFQETKVFANMPVFQNVLVGASFGTPIISKGHTFNGLGLGEKTRKPTAAGILSIIGGLGWMILATLCVIASGMVAQFIGMELTGGLAAEFSAWIDMSGALFTILGLVAIVGGVYGLRRRGWGWALAGSICALPFLPLGLPAVVFVIFGKREFAESSTAWADAAKEATRALEFVGLSAMTMTPVKDLTLANQKRVEVARALATKPKLLLLDELMAGLNPAEVGEAMELVTRIRDRGVTIVMVEHVMKAIMGISSRVMVLHHGEKIAEGTCNEVSCNKTVIDIYLGEQTHAGS